MPALRELVLTLIHLIYELLVTPRTHLSGQQSLVQEALMQPQLLVQAEGLGPSLKVGAGVKLGLSGGRSQTGGRARLLRSVC